jgi:hypothetical protein
MLKISLLGPEGNIMMKILEGRQQPAQVPDNGGS